MIRCPKCNTLNRDSSRFCSECGAPLHKTRIRCPQCGTLNPVGNIFCDHCHARLLPAEDADSVMRETKPSEETLPRVQGISLPTRPSPASEDSNADEKAELPDWLMGFLAPEGTEPEAAGAKAAALGSLSSPTEEESEPLAPSELPDWLLGLTAEEEPVSAAPEGKLEPAEGLPDWLSGLGAEGEPVSAAPEAELEPAEGLPDWLSGLGAEEEPVSAAPEGKLEPAEGLPDWLSGLGAEEEPVSAAPEADLEPAEGLPDWLSGLGAEEEPVSAAPEAELEPAEGLPDWLSGLVAEEEPVSDAPEAEPEPAEGLPDWLSGMMEQPVAGRAAAAMEPEPAPAAGEFPDWLSGMMEEISSEPPSAAELAGELDMHEPAAGLEPAALPDWLAGIADELPETGAKPLPKEQETPTRAEAPLPDWLSAWEEGAGAKLAETDADLLDLDDEDTWPEREALVPDSKPESAGVAEPAEVPEWLRALGPRPDAAGVEALPEGLEQAEVPTWLEQLRPPGTAPLDASRAPEVAPGEETSEGGLVRAEIPDWVQQYRPTSTSAAEAASLLDAVLESSPESEGPLSGLVGLLPALPVVDAPAQPGTRMTSALPQTVVQEAQLWQQLLERGAGDVSTKPKARARATWSATVIRVVVALALALVSVLRFTETPLALPPEQPAVAALQTSIAALQPADTVLVAFEYTLADVDEMNFIVEALLEHLLTREVRIVAVSTLPEGPGIIEERFAWAAIRPDVSSASLTNRGFVPGGASGVASILANPIVEDEPALVLVITSRPEKLKAWVEQNVVANGMRVGAGRPALPLAAGVSAATVPQTRPYLDASVDAGWLSGFSGVASYWQARGLPPREDISRRLDALLLTQWVAVSFLLAGAIFYGLAGKQRTV
ncbi:MAG: zinc ribbon domain-containing protein [Anaerolineae bacterium]|nr:zinc ribbon domain-containing protein [Anaerolineae bacterium]